MTDASLNQLNTSDEYKVLKQKKKKKKRYKKGKIKSYKKVQNLKTQCIQPYKIVWNCKTSLLWAWCSTPRRCGQAVISLLVWHWKVIAILNEVVIDHQKNFGHQHQKTTLPTIFFFFFNLVAFESIGS